MASIGFKGFGWILGIATVLPACYMVTSAVAAERGRVEAVERAIIRAQRDIRGLETEFDTRANIAQLERYNGEVLALSAPRPEQYVAGEAALASLRPLGEGQVRYAALVVPAGIQQPELQQAELRPAVAALPSPPAIEAVASEVKRAVATGKAQSVAMLDGKLLSDSTIGDVMARARSEATSLR
ncbi:hypothetical protein [Sphingomonas sp.]|uniref:hypothetical protein n=1 Tax=Sphingomonas sp. TaxID=28214 RepID=UPI002C2E2D2C|nr:hypothetical protein [Sphingomonas sp.]HWK36433.1 hypothetical protein [Sphingomonas sp.]